MNDVFDQAPGARDRGQGRLSLVVTAIDAAAEGVRLVDLKDPQGAALPPFTAGSHIDLLLPEGIVRQYSLTSDQSDPTAYQVAIKLDPNSRGGSKFIHEQLRVGDEIAASFPRNSFPLDETANHSVLIAGGIGVTPIWSLMRRLEQLGRSWEMHYSVRSRREALFLPALADYGARVLLNIDEESGALLDLRAIVETAPSNSSFYCCGPGPMLNAFNAATAGLPPERLHQEHFSSPDAPDLAGGYKVVLNRSGRTIDVPPGSTILEALQNAGFNPDYSCLAGVCGTCETRVLDGRPDHRDAVLTPAERAANRTMMICCSGSLDPSLVLDL